VEGEPDSVGNLKEDGGGGLNEACTGALAPAGTGGDPDISRVDVAKALTRDDGANDG